MAIQWNGEQLAIIARAGGAKNNLLVEALAGAAKTTTLVEVAKNLSGSVLCIAFNKKIADEMKERMPQGVDCRTLNALGHRIWGQALGSPLKVSDDKLRRLMMDHADQLEPEEREHIMESYQDVMSVLRGSKNHGHVPDSAAERFGRRVVPLMNDETFYSMLPEVLSQCQRTLCEKVLSESFAMAMHGQIDFADQLLMPTVVKCVYPNYDNILVDEAQDLSEANHVMLTKLTKRRIIAVGDSKQAIYAFRGAHTSGMPLLADRFDMEVLHLSTTFRCPEAICDHVRWHVPRIQPWEGNPNNPGKIESLKTIDINDIPDGAAIICRNNAPLFTLAIKFLRSGRRAQVWGRDIAVALISVMEKLGAPNMEKSEALKALHSWHMAKLAKTRKESAKNALQDRVDCIRIFLEDAESLAGAIAFARNVLNSEGKVDLCTGHKAKGHEWTDVYILDNFLINLDEEQERNLIYVMATRSQRNLTYIYSDGVTL